MDRVPKELTRPSRCVGPRKSEDLWASTFTEDWGGTHKKKGTSLMPLKVTRSQSTEGRKWNLWHIGAPGHLSRVFTVYL